MTADKTTAKCGETITYTFTVTDTGNTCFYGGVTVDDALLGGQFFHQTPVSPGQSFTFTKKYTVKEGDPTLLVNKATATGHVPAGSGVKDATDTESVSVTTECSGSSSKPPCGGDTGTIGFWHSRKGHDLIDSLNGGCKSKDLPNWLAQKFPNLYGKNSKTCNLTGKCNEDVVTLFERCFRDKGRKTDAQILASALSCYVSQSKLAGDKGIACGFNVSAEGTGSKTWKLGSKGSKLGLADNTECSVFGLLQQADRQRGQRKFDADAFGCVFTEINKAGER